MKFKALFMIFFLLLATIASIDGCTASHRRLYGIQKRSNDEMDQEEAINEENEQDDYDDSSIYDE